MNILRKIGVSLCASLLSVVLLGLAWSNVGLSTVRNRDTVKGWLDKSGFYTNVVDVVLEKVNESAQKGEADINISDPAVQAIAKKAFSPEFLKQNVEKILDGGYSWADGSSDTIAFSIDLSSAKQQLATGLGDYATTKVAALPVCAPNEVTQQFDSFNATCRPAGLTPEQAGQKVSSDLLNSKEFLSNPVITSSDLRIKNGVTDAQNQPVENTEEAKAIRKVYQFSGLVPVVLAIVALALSLGVIFLSTDHFRGLRRTGWVFVTSGLILLVTYLVFGAIMMAVDRKIAETAVDAARNRLLGDFAEEVIDSVKRALLPYAIGLTVSGIAMVVTGGKLTNRRDNANKKEFEEHKNMLPEPALKPVDKKVVDTDEVKVIEKPSAKKDK